MNDYGITDELLYEVVPLVEKIILDCIPKDADLNHKFSNKFNKKMKILIKRNVNIKPEKAKVSKCGRKR